MSTSISELETKGFVVVDYPEDLRLAVDRAVDSWKAFCALPAAMKQELPYSSNSDGVGYEIKDGLGDKADQKENFDVAHVGEGWLAEHIGDRDDKTVVSFLQSATSLVRILKPVILDFARQCETASGLEGFADEVEASEDAFFLRFIHYFGNRNPGEEIATAHADQSGFTLHLYESGPGLQCLTFGRQWINMPVSDGKTVIIPAMQLQLRSHGDLKALCHRVIATPETADSGRYSAVCFVQLKRTPKYDKDAHGRLQEKEPGFNYSLTREKFSQFFKG